MLNVCLDQFQWFVPKPQNPCAITIVTQEQLNCNSKLVGELPQNFEIGVSPDGKVLGIREKSSGYKRLTSGRIKDKELVKAILSKDIQIPARYLVTKQDEIWIAELEIQEKPVLNLAKPPRRPRKKDVSGLMSELEALR